MPRLILLVLPLALDTFAVSAALGLAGVTPRRRLGLGLLFAGFEGGMPLIGLFAGSAVSGLIGDIGEYFAIAALAVVGAYLLVADDEKEEARAARFVRANGVALLAVGLSVSIDELAIGFALGLARVPVVQAVILIAVQAFVVSQVGFALGNRISERVREGAERLAGVALIAIAGLLLLARFVQIPI
jgi:putative Mn2+ efflux pump MntP